MTLLTPIHQEGGTIDRKFTRLIFTERPSYSLYLLGIPKYNKMCLLKPWF